MVLTGSGRIDGFGAMLARFLEHLFDEVPPVLLLRRPQDLLPARLRSSGVESLTFLLKMVTNEG